MEKLNFVYVLGENKHDEIKFSVRSVLRLYNNANILIIGQKPDCLSVDHCYMDDNDTILINIWNKMIKACSFFDEWVLMNDDFFLLKHLPKYHFYSTMFPKKISSIGEMIRVSRDMFPDSPNYMVHTPLWIHSKTFLQNINKSISPRMMYCNNENKYKRVKIKDVKYMKPITTLNSDLFFSIGSWNNNKSFVKRMFPDKCHLE